MIEIKDIYGNVIYTSEIDETLNKALCRAVKQDANLRGANLCYADLRGANLRGANLRGANLQGANLQGANLYVPLHCPSHGEFIGWKKVNNCIIKMLIPEDAKRLSAATNKCRCDKAKVLEITDISNGEQKEFIINTNYVVTKYEVGKTVKPDSFDENRWNECSNGIHFFINKEDAIRY